MKKIGPLWDEVTAKKDFDIFASLNMITADLATSKIQREKKGIVVEYCDS